MHPQTYQFIQPGTNIRDEELDTSPTFTPGSSDLHFPILPPRPASVETPTNETGSKFRHRQSLPPVSTLAELERELQQMRHLARSRPQQRPSLLRHREHHCVGSATRFCRSIIFLSSTSGTPAETAATADSSHMLRADTRLG